MALFSFAALGGGPAPAGDPPIPDPVEARAGVPAEAPSDPVPSDPAQIGTGGSTIPPASVPRADSELLRRLAVEGRVATRVPTPGVDRYLGDAGSAFLFWLARLLEPYLEKGGLLDRLIRSGVPVLLGVLLLVFLIVTVRGFLRRSVTAGPKAAEVERAAAASEDRDPDRELRAAFESGDVAAALAALWWWLAKALGASEAEQAWTTRELVVRAGRRDLLPAVRPYDHLVYGGGTVTMDDVRRLHTSLQQATGPGLAAVEGGGGTSSARPTAAGGGGAA